MRQYLDLLRAIKESGDDHSDRTGVGTKSLFGYQMRFDLAEGFPLMTTKRLPFKVIAEELFWFISGSTHVDDLRLRLDAAGKPIKIWDAWATKEQCAKFGRPEGDLGPIYGKQWRSWETHSLVERRTIPKPTQSISRVLDNCLPEPGEYPKCGTAAVGGDYHVLRTYRMSRNDGTAKTRQVFDVQFKNSGYIATAVNKSNVLSGLIRDPYAREFNNIACMGQPRDAVLRDLLLETWKGMIQRCYNPKHSGYANYGARGVWVCDRWLVFEKFVEDFKSIPNWPLKLCHPEEYTLDKDKSGWNYYSPETCVWSSKDEQSLNTEQTETFRATSPSGETYTAFGLRPFCRAHGLTRPSVAACLRGERTNHKGWTFEKLTPPDGYKVVYHKVDQIKKLCANLRHDPRSRRLIVSAYNAAEIDQMALEPCHTMFHLKWHETTNRLDLQLYQRSADVFLGVPFNIASYALLLELLAFTHDMLAGEFIHTFGDVHIYNTHPDQVDEQLSREPRALPLLGINPRLRDGGVDALLGATFSDLSLLKYDPMPSIKAEVAV